MQKLYFCEYTLQFFKHRSQLMRHLSKVRTRHPPGDEIYRNGNVCMFEVSAWDHLAPLLPPLPVPLPLHARCPPQWL